MKSDLFKNVISLFLMQGINYLVPLITLPYLVRVLGPHEYGVLGSAFSLVQYLALFVDFGFNLSSTERIAANKNNPNLISEIFWQTMAAKLFMLILSLLFLIGFAFFVADFQEVRWVLICYSLYLIGTFLFPIWFFQGIEKMNVVAIITSLIKLLSVPFTFFLVSEKSDTMIAAVVQGSIIFVSGTVAIFFVKKEGLIKKPNYKKLEILASLKNSCPFFIGSIGISLYTLSTPLILGLVNVYSEVGYYSAADKLRSAMLGLFFVLGGAFFPRITVLMKKDKELAYVFLRKLTLIQGSVTFFASVFFYIVMPFLARWILGHQYDNSGILFKIMAPMIFLAPMSVIICNYFILSHGHTKIYATIPLVTTFIHLPYTWFLSKNYGAIGASYSMLFTEIIGFSILLFISIRLGIVQAIFLKKNNNKDL